MVQHGLSQNHHTRCTHSLSNLNQDIIYCRSNTNFHAFLGLVVSLMKIKTLNTNGHATVNTIALAQVFNKRHSQLINLIEGLEYSDSFLLNHFVAPSVYLSTAHVSRNYQVSLTGFLILTAGFTGIHLARIDFGLGLLWDEFPRQDLLLSLSSVFLLYSEKYRDMFLKLPLRVNSPLDNNISIEKQFFP